MTMMHGAFSAPPKQVSLFGEPAPSLTKGRRQSQPRCPVASGRSTPSKGKKGSAYLFPWEVKEAKKGGK